MHRTTRPIALLPAVLGLLVLAAAPSFAAELAAVEATWLPPGGTAGVDEIPMWGFIDVSPKRPRPTSAPGGP